MGANSRAIRVVIPDTGPLISLAVGEALELLLAVSDDVRIVITDVVEFEATHRAEAYVDGAAINAFLHANAPRVEVMPTTVGQLALADARRRAEAGEAWTLPRDLGELSITNFVISLRTVNPGDPMLVLTEDDWFATNTYVLPGNVHLLSTAAFLDGLEAAGRIPSAAAVRARIQAARPHFKADWVLDRPAEKIATEWRSRVKRKRR